jgi:hypothetical protein
MRHQVVTPSAKIPESSHDHDSCVDYGSEHVNSLFAGPAVLKDSVKTGFGLGT